TWRLDVAAKRWKKLTEDRPEWSDSAGWSGDSHTRTLRLVPHGRHLYLLARSGSGVDTWRLDPRVGWSKLASDRPPWSDRAGWDRARHYETMRVVAHGRHLYLVGRAAEGIETWRLDPRRGRWTRLGGIGPRWSDGSGWGDE